MRLIDADRLNEVIERNFCYPGCLKQIVDAQPTAYDVDKVVKQLEENTELAYKRYIDGGENMPPSVYARYSAQYQERKMCLDIVKAEMKG